ncbi:unnamed protein product [Urochloa decumbens]|uniref:Uncharacterized protein n=1 Tax=Urochloa decumbens TaxID=240449 RepID=A0ABC9BWI1_9POAL
MDARNSRSILMDAVPGRAVCTNDASAMQEILAIDEKMAKTTQKLEADFSKVEAKIHRFPRGLHGIGGDGGRYIAPSVVAIGPYHHGTPELEKMEEVKLAAAYYLCRNSGHSTVEVYERVRSVAAAARGCYEADDASVARQHGGARGEHVQGGGSGGGLVGRLRGELVPVGAGDAHGQRRGRAEAEGQACVLYSTFSNKQALGFFKGLSQHLRFGSRYFAVLEQIDSYKRQKSVRIAIHRLLYNSFKAMTIATLFSIVGVLVGIFKTPLDNKKQ